MTEASQKKVMVTLPVLLVGGTEIQTLAVVKALLIDEYRVEVCCYYEYEGEVVDQFRTAGAEVILLGLDRSGQRSSLVALWTLLRRLVDCFGSPPRNCPCTVPGPWPCSDAGGPPRRYPNGLRHRSHSRQPRLWAKGQGHAANRSEAVHRFFLRFPRRRRILVWGKYRSR